MPPTSAAELGNLALLEVVETGLPGVLEVRPTRIGDIRGFFSETWSEARFAEAGIDCPFVQDNHSRSEQGVLRGLHFQLPPAAQAKLIRVTNGSIFDVAVDIRRSSATFGRWTGVLLSAERWNQLFVPAGFAHGFLALESRCDVQYKVSAPYSPTHDRSIRPDDPAIGIDWPLECERWTLSAKDATAPLLEDAELFA